MLRDMSSDDSSIIATQIERDILRELCAGQIESKDWHSIVNRLSAHEWRDPEHKVVFDALQAVKSDDALTRRQELPAQATRMGFPDVDWGKYLDADAQPGVPIEQLIGGLASAEND
jgi:hypothetical protein